MSRQQKSLYRILAPHGSRRDRFVWIAAVTVRKLREGPGPWLRAVKKGIYQLLPTSVQQRVLRWTGQDEFFRRSHVRHSAADAGAEQPGMVSVVLPVFDQADLIGQAIDSVLRQSYANLELIVVDDGSTDGVQDVLRRYLPEPRVRVVTQPNQGLPKALSTGFEFATGEFFTWTSADNLMGKEQLTRMIAFLREHQDVAMVYADYEVIDDRGEPLVGGEFRVMDRVDKHNLAAVRVNRSTHDLNRYEDNFIGGCFLYRGQVGRLLGDYNPELGLEDYDYWLRINRLFRIEHLGTDELLYRYRVHDNTLSARARELKILERAKALMGYERERAAWLQAPLRVLADADSMAWLDGALDAGDTLAPFEQQVPADDRKTLLVLTPRDLARVPLDELPPHAGVAAWFANPDEVYPAHAQLQHLPVAAFAADAATAARLGVFTRAVFRGTPGRDALTLARQHLANGTFFRRTRDRDRLRRAVPTPLLAREPLRVLLQVDTFGQGGLERVVEDLAECLIEAGCEVGLLAVDGTTTDTPAPAAVEQVRLTTRDAQGYASMLRDGRWQVVSAHASVFGAEAAEAGAVPFVQTVHNSYVWLDRDQIAAYRAADAATSAYACVSAQALGYADLRLQLDVQKMLVIENGVDPAPDQRVAEEQLRRLRAELGLGEGDFAFLQVASLQPAKAHRIAVHALARLRQREPRAKLVCLGSDMNPVHAAAVRSDVARLGLGDAVVFAGHRDDAAVCYAMADAFVLPSFWEGCSLAVWEAIRADLPLALADVGAAREQLRHGTGVLIAPPFESMFELDATNVDAVVRDVDDAFVERTANAMQQVVRLAAGRPRQPGRLPRLAERRTMADRHLLLFRWLLQRGTVAGLRATIARAGS